MVTAAADVSFADGHCLSYDWFEKESAYFCPMTDDAAPTSGNGLVVRRQSAVSQASRPA